MGEERIECVCGIICKVNSEKMPDGNHDVYTFKVDGWEECSITGRRAAKRVINGRLDAAVRNTMMKPPKGE